MGAGRQPLAPDSGWDFCYHRAGEFLSMVGSGKLLSQRQVKNCIDPGRLLYTILIHEGRPAV